MSAAPLCLFRLGDDCASVGEWCQRTGSGEMILGSGPLPDVAPDVQRVMIAPAADVCLRWLALPDLPPAQLRAVARRELADHTLASPDAIHVAVGRRDELHGETPVAWVGADQMRHWIDTALALGVDPDAVILAAAMLPRPEAGYLRSTVLNEPVARGAHTGFADIDDLLAVIAADAPVETAALSEDAITAAAQLPVIDLRQGDFAKRRPFVIDRHAVRRMAIVALGIVAVLLITEITRLIRYETATAAIDRGNLAAVAAALPREKTISNPEAQLDNRLAALTGGGVGFASTSADIFAALQSVPGIDLQAISFGPDGRLRARISADGADSVATLERAMRDRRLIIDPAELRMEGNRPTGDIVVRGQ